MSSRRKYPSIVLPMSASRTKQLASHGSVIVKKGRGMYQITKLRRRGRGLDNPTFRQRVSRAYHRAKPHIASAYRAIKPHAVSLFKAAAKHYRPLYDEQVKNLSDYIGSRGDQYGVGDFGRNLVHAAGNSAFDRVVGGRIRRRRKHTSRKPRMAGAVRARKYRRKRNCM